ncbi:MAG: glycosyltransferase family 2 protein, partial [Gemmatimonadaceae bacterium]
MTADYSVIVPAFNEAENVDALFEELGRAIASGSTKGEVVFVDDGSTDETWSLAVAAATTMGANARVVRHRRNLGKTEAILTGAREASSDVFVIFDADLQHSADEIPRFVAGIVDGWDIVTGRKIGQYE